MRDDPFAISHTAQTMRGLYDLDGDGKADMVFIDGTVYAASNGSAGDWGRPAAGRLTSIDNGQGALTRITYRSAKDDGFAAHQVAFPEIVASRIETVKSSDGTPLAAEIDHAFGDPEMVFDSLTMRWSFSGYRRMITMELDGSGTGRMTVTDTNPLQPMVADQTQIQRFVANGRVGQPRDVTSYAGAMNDPWDELGVGLGDSPDPRVIGATHYDYDAQMVTEATPPPSAFCREMVDPYDLRDTQDHTSSWPVCATHGLTFASNITAWRGTAAPPSTANVTTTTMISRDTAGRITDQLEIGDGENPRHVALSYAVPTAAPGSNAPRVLNAVTSRIVAGILFVPEAAESWQYDGDNPDTPNGSVSSGFPTTHTVMRISEGLGDLGSVRTSFAWNPNGVASGALDSVASQRMDPDGFLDGASRTMKLTNYDEFGMVATVTEVDAISPAGAPAIPSMISTVTPDLFTLATLQTTDPNGTLRGVCFDGLGRIRETYAGASTGAMQIMSTTSYAGFASGEAGPRQVTNKNFIDLTGPAVDPSQPQKFCDNAPPTASTPGISSTVFLDELARPSYTATQLGTNYGNQTLITGAQVFDLWGRTIYAADPHVSTQTLPATYGTSSYFQADGTPDCIIRGPAGATGPHALTRVTDEASEVYPTCFTRTFASNSEFVDTQSPDSLLLNSPQSGVIHRDIKSATGRVLSRSSKQGGSTLEYAEFDYDTMGRLAQMRRYLDPINHTTPAATTWSWDSVGQLVELDETGEGPRERRYSSWGELVEENWSDTSSATAIVHRVSHRYDGLGRMLHSEENQQTGNEKPTLDTDSINDYVYDAGSPLLGGTADFTPTNLRGRLAQASSPTQTVALSYDVLGRLNGRAFTDGQLYVETRGYHSDNTLDKLHLFLPDHLVAGRSVDEFATYSYDSMRRLSGVSYSDGTASESLFSGTRDVFGRVTQGQYDATTLTASYAPGGRRLLQDWKLADGAGAHSREVSLAASGSLPTYDPAGRQRQRGEVIGDGPARVSEQYTYDALGQLSTWTQSQTLPLSGHSRFYNYDKLGNLSSIINGDQSPQQPEVMLSYGGADPDRVMHIAYGGGAQRGVTYDFAGNVTQMPTAGGGTRTITYFNNGDVRSIANDAGDTAQYTYDAFGNVAQLEIDSVNAGNTRHDRHYGSTIAVRDELVGGVPQPVVVRNILGDGGILATRHGVTANWTFAFGEDKGNRFFADRSATFIQSASYSAFGAPWNAPPAEKRSAAYSSVKWNGGDELEAFGVTRIGARLYDPAIGRFLSRDPIVVPRSARTTNPYSFAVNDPVNSSDPTGLQSWNPNGQGPGIFESLFENAAGAFVTNAENPSNYVDALAGVAAVGTAGAALTVLPEVCLLGEAVDATPLAVFGNGALGAPAASTATAAATASATTSAASTALTVSSSAGSLTLPAAAALPTATALGGNSLAVITPVAQAVGVGTGAAAFNALTDAPIVAATPVATPGLIPGPVAATWQQHELNVTAHLRATTGAQVGEQITLDITNNATGASVRIRVDDIYRSKSGAYQLVDAKFSSVVDLSTSNLSSAVTPNQRLAYGWIRSGNSVTVAPAGGNAARFGLPTNGGTISIVNSIQMIVNNPGGMIPRVY